MISLNFLGLSFDEYQLEQVHSALKILNSSYHFNTKEELASYIDLATPREQKLSMNGSWGTLGFLAIIRPPYDEDNRPRVSLSLHTCIVPEILKLADECQKFGLVRA